MMAGAGVVRNLFALGAFAEVMPAGKTVAAPSQSVVTLRLADENATTRLAATLVRVARVGDVLALRGPLGAGKTTFARAFINARRRYHGGELEEVPSPTFTLVQTYEFADAMVFHFDLFRIMTSSEAFELGIEDAMAEGIVLIEWPERLGTLLPHERLDIALAPGVSENARQVTLTGFGAWRERLNELHFDV
jgi:tRNA threonylcarbamoyladenosine biosynthesis protein TsaE